MKLGVRHETRFTYEVPVTHGLSEARVLPRSTPGQTVLAADVAVDPEPDDRAEHLDFFGNRVVHLAVARSHSVLAVTATAEVDVATAAPGTAADGPWDAGRWRRSPDIVPFVVGSPLVEADGATADYARASFPPGRPLREAATNLTERIHRDFVYQPGVTTVLTPVSEVMARHRGVCAGRPLVQQVIRHLKPPGVDPDVFRPGVRQPGVCSGLVYRLAGFGRSERDDPRRANLLQQVAPCQVAR